MAQDDLFGDGSFGEASISNRGSSFFEVGPHAPLAARMRPRTIDEVAGQRHLLGEGKPLRRLVEGSGAASVILYGLSLIHI